MAISPEGLSLVWASSTARCRNSGANGTGMTGILFGGHTVPTGQVSGLRGQAQTPSRRRCTRCSDRTVWCSRRWRPRRWWSRSAAPGRADRRSGFPTGNSRGTATQHGVDHRSVDTPTIPHATMDRPMARRGAGVIVFSPCPPVVLSSGGLATFRQRSLWVQEWSHDVHRWNNGESRRMFVPSATSPGQED